MKIDSKAIKELAELLNDTGLTEIEVADGDQAIRVSKGGTVVAGAPAAAPIAMPSDPTEPQAANTAAPSNVASSHPGAVTSPMVGTAYMAAEPGAAPFVSKGDSVNVGDTLMIIEAMKVMNPIKADKAGTVTQILVENADPIEFGDVLMVIE
jgi:acetyl-CoA carboxylase biotin carboxyl carrier protein